MVGIYFTGTGNTKHCMELLVSSVDKEAECISITDKRVLKVIESNEVIFLGYPTQFSNMPFFIRDFIKKGLLSSLTYADYLVRDCGFIIKRKVTQIK